MWQIPRLGTEIELLSDWIFDLYYETRNESLLTLAGCNPLLCWQQPFAGKVACQYVFQKGMVLIVDRIYLRKNCPDFDSITFRTKNKFAGKKPRFWAKLIDVVNMDVKIIKW